MARPGQDPCGEAAAVNAAAAPRGPDSHLLGGGVQQTEGEDAVQHGGRVLRPSLGIQMDDGLPVTLRQVLKAKLLLDLSQAKRGREQDSLSFSSEPKAAVCIRYPQVPADEGLTSGLNLNLLARAKNSRNSHFEHFPTDL